MSHEKYSKLCKESYKIKRPSDGTYKKMPKGVTKDNQNNFNKVSGYQSGRSKLFCTNCRFTHKTFNYPMFQNEHSNNTRYFDSEKCSSCGAEKSIISLDSSVRIPRKKANEKIWKNFYKLFVEPKKCFDLP